MYPLHDKDLDRLSRDAAEHYEVDSGPSGWEQLEKRLDQELPQQRGRRRFLFWLFFIVVTTGSALTALLINSQPVTPLASSVRAIAQGRQEPAALNNPTEAPTKAKKAIADNNTAGQSIDKPITEAGKQPVGATSKAITTPQNQNNKQPTTAGASEETVPADQLQNDNTNKPVTVGSNNKTVRSLNKRTVRGNNTLTAPVTPQPFGLNRQKGRKNNLAKKPTAINDKNDQVFDRINDVAAAPDNQKDVAVTQEPVTTPVTTEPANATAAPSNTPKPAAATDSAAAPAIAKKDSTQKKMPSFKQSLELGLVAGPDVSMIEFGPLYKAGYNLGLQIGYRISERWSVNTGVIYTKRYYKATGEQFHPPKHSPISYLDIDKLEGFCAMLDIPVNVRYDFSISDKRRFFANVGVSSYLMHEQYYDYSYRTQTGGYYTKSWDSSEWDNYLFSILNLSIGYERKLSDHFSIQAEPYLKVPFKGLGYGSMKMGSYGIFFSLKYRPSFGSKNTAIKK